MNSSEFLELVQELYGSDWPRPLHLVRGTMLIEEGHDVRDAARSVGTTAARLKHLMSVDDRLADALQLSIRNVEQSARERAIRILGQLLLGQAAEKAFESIFREELESHELEMRDLREGRSDTDYRLYNGQGRPVYRVNIKFHGALFRRAPELVGIDPNDCFALATYKICGALKKQETEGLPYIFAVVGVRSLSGDDVGVRLPGRYVEATAYIYQAPRASGKRDFEEKIVARISQQRLDPFDELYEAIHSADWFVISARKADLLVRKKLYERVYALRVPRFTQQFRGAEVDMHFSLSADMTPLRDFLGTVREEGHPKAASMLERGNY